MSARLVLMNQRHNADVVRSLEVIRTAQDLELNITEANSSQRGFMLTGRQMFQQRYERAFSAIAGRLQQLEQLTSDGRAEREQMMALRAQVEARVAELAKVDRLISAGKADEAVGRVTFALMQMDAVRMKLEVLMAEEREMLKVRHARADDSGNWLLVLTVLGLGLAIVLVSSSIAKLQRKAADLETANAEVIALNEGLEARVAERTVELVEANAEVQRFAHVISHDLRSPLVNVMGFTAEIEETQQRMIELLDRIERADPSLVNDAEQNAVREELPEAIAFIRASTSRMDRLIKSILGLSRSGRRDISAEDIDLSALIGILSDSLRSQADAAHARFDIAQLPTIESDRVALEQIFGNLLDNAIKYLRPGVPGVVCVSAEEGRSIVRIHVADNGRGIAERDQERVFDLFRRAGEQNTQGEGVGLAHVRALVRRLGGAIRLESREGEGSRFTVTLPRRVSDIIQARGF